MPSLPSIVTSYLTSVKNSLDTGTDLGSNVYGAAQNYLRAQDMATVLDLLQDGLDSGTLTATGGTATSVQDGAGTFSANEQVGNVVVFDGNITSALAGVEARVVNNTATELFFADDALPATPQTSDTYSIRGGIADTAIDFLREGNGLADAPAGNVYGTHRIVLDALIRMIDQLGGTRPVRNVGASALQTGSGSTDTVIQVDTLGADFRIDQLKGMILTISGEDRLVSHNTEDTITVYRAFSSAPSSATSISIGVPVDVVGGSGVAPKTLTHPGANPGENLFLSELINQAEAAVVAYTVPT